MRADPLEKDVPGRRVICFLLARFLVGKKGLQLLLVSKELLLPLDIIGLQIRRSDIVAIDENDNVYLVEMKTRIPRGKVLGVETQVGEYKTVFERNLEFIRDKPRIYYYQYILKRYFEFINKDITKIQAIIPVILSMTGVNSGDFTIPAGSFTGTERERVIKTFEWHRAKKYCWKRVWADITRVLKKHEYIETLRYGKKNFIETWDEESIVVRTERGISTIDVSSIKNAWENLMIHGELQRQDHARMTYRSSFICALLSHLEYVGTRMGRSMSIFIK
ncbi:MAG: hypothetical protein ACTSUE_27490 [Promethearchaeota archaeon]